MESIIKSDFPVIYSSSQNEQALVEDKLSFLQKRFVLPPLSLCGVIDGNNEIRETWAYPGLTSVFQVCLKDLWSGKALSVNDFVDLITLGRGFGSTLFWEPAFEVMEKLSKVNCY